MTTEHRIEQLQHEFGFSPAVARAAMESDCLCSYCGEDLLASRAGYSSISRDRLIPGYKGPENNDALACCSCNRMKGRFDPLREGEDADHMLRTRKDELILRVRTHLQQPIVARKSEWYRVRDIIRGGSPFQLQPKWQRDVVVLDGDQLAQTRRRPGFLAPSTSPRKHARSGADTETA